MTSATPKASAAASSQASTNAGYELIGKECFDAAAAFEKQAALGASDAEGGLDVREGSDGRMGYLAVRRLRDGDAATEYMKVVQAYVTACSQAVKVHPKMAPLTSSTSSVPEAIAYERPSNLGDGDRLTVVRHGRQVIEASSRVSQHSADQLAQLELDKMTAADHAS
ncbi:hypothetical protein [Sinomonas notoginsengisoli]|uniref:hypothetical protein n=1 Tax=Sinomonas notoginsengisoli TaxID=1457311 RepID=UPI001F347570|nr:hypothetical protein [Sinomonas notoginsengisoli]